MYQYKTKSMYNRAFVLFLPLIEAICNVTTTLNSTGNVVLFYP